MDNQMQESGNDNLTIVDNASPNEGEEFLTAEIEPSTELSAPIMKVNVGVGFGAKIVFGTLGVAVLWVSGFLVMNNYEYENNCIIGINDGFILNGEINPVLCKTIRAPTEAERFFGREYPGELMKPLILLYPPKEQEVQVELEYVPGFSATFPEYDNSKKGWSVSAHPDGTLLDHSTLQQTYGLFWEGNGNNTEYDLSKGWIVKGSELREFLYEKLSEIGLNTKEKSDFIMFWYPKLQNHSYIQVTFAGDDYAKSAPLKIIPKPDSLLRVFMVAKPLESQKEIEPQKLEKFERKGFIVVEWGGTILE